MAGMFEAVEEAAQRSVGDVIAYFGHEPGVEGEDAKERNLRIDRAIKILSIYSRTRATRANEMSVAVLIARQMGLRGEALAPMWEQLTNSRAAGFLPAPKEDDGGGDRKATRKRR